MRAGRLGLAVALILAAVFTVWPELDLWTSAQFRDTSGAFTGNGWTWVRVLYRGIPVSGWLLGLTGLAVFRHIEVEDAEFEAKAAQQFAPARGLGGEIEHRVLSDGGMPVVPDSQWPEG